MQDKFTAEKLDVILLSVDQNREMYAARASELFRHYGGSEWAQVLLPKGFADAIQFGDFGYGKVIVDANGMVRAVNPLNLEQVLDRIFEGAE